MIPDTVTAGECHAEALSWTLPDILQEIESEAGPAFVWDLIDTFEADAKERVGMAWTAVADDDREALGKHCHRLKGGSRQMGATVLGAIYDQIERSCQDMSSAELSDSMQRASAEFLQFCRQMRTYSGSRDQPLQDSSGLTRMQGTTTPDAA
jgi:HPt (histidine-containing phosphotransfer) domain-containing protein